MVGCRVHAAWAVGLQIGLLLVAMMVGVHRAKSRHGMHCAACMSFHIPSK